jgi:hypothetical protein
MVILWVVALVAVSLLGQLKLLAVRGRDAHQLCGGASQKLGPRMETPVSGVL